jgi:hypothetical protein
VGEDEECTQHSTRNSKELENGQQRVYQQLQIKSQKNKLLRKNNTAVSELSISSSSHQEQKLRRNKQPDHNTKQRPPQQPQKKEGGKKNSDQILYRKVSLFLSQTETAESQSRAEKRTQCSRGRE